MYKIISKSTLCNAVVKMEIEAPLVARKAEPGQFIILRVSEDGERIPLTIADFNRSSGSVTIIFQTVGATTKLLAAKNAGEYISDFVGPLGKATETDRLCRVAIIGGGVGCAIALPIAKKLHEAGATVHSIVGFRSEGLVILKDEFASASDKLFLMTDDGSAGEKGLVTDKLRSLIEFGEKYDEVIAIGPLVMMKFVCGLTEEFGIKTVVSMNPIMIDGTGMCGCCRLTVGGKTVFACVDGPDFDGHLVDFDEVIKRNSMYREFEKRCDETTCNLLKRGKENG